MRQHFTAPLLLSIALSALVGCASPTGNEKSASAQAGEPTDNGATRTSTDLKEAPEQREMPIPESSVLPLLKAEFALRARDFELGSSLLTEQAMVLNDPALTRRALRLAEFISDEQRAAALSLRLAELDPNDGAAAAAARPSRCAYAVWYRSLGYATCVGSSPSPRGSDPKGGGVEHGPTIFNQPTCHHAPETIGGVSETDAAVLLKVFFGSRR